MAGTSIDEILNTLHKLQNELETEIDQLLTEKRKQFQYRIDQGKVKFEQGIQALQRHQKEGLWSYLTHARISHVLSAPFIYGLIFPFVLLDIGVTIYQEICFRVYGIPKISRKNYIAIDRHHLAYLNAVEKLNCVYCGYGNGLIAYVREVAARTEQYWCPIKHARRTRDPHRLTQKFIDYGDAQAYKNRLIELQEEIASLKTRVERDQDNHQ